MASADPIPTRGVPGSLVFYPVDRGERGAGRPGSVRRAGSGDAGGGPLSGQGPSNWVTAAKTVTKYVGPVWNALRCAQARIRERNPTA